MSVEEDLRQEIKELKENHFAHLASDMTDLKINMAQHGNDLSWLKKMFFLVASASVGSFATAIWNVITTQ